MNKIVIHSCPLCQCWGPNTFLSHCSQTRHSEGIKELVLVFSISLKLELFLSFKILFSVRSPDRINAYDWNAVCSQLKRKYCSKYIYWVFTWYKIVHKLLKSFLQVPFSILTFFTFSPAAVCRWVNVTVHLVLTGAGVLAFHLEHLWSWKIVFYSRLEVE